MIHLAHLCIALAIPALATAAAASDVCSVAAIAELPVTMSGLRPLVHAEINGKTAKFTADSGAWFSVISPGSAAEYGLKLQAVSPRFVLKGVGGSVRPSVTTVDTFTIAGAPVRNVQFLVGGSEFGSVGLLGQNILALGDTEFDLGKGMIRLMRSQGCADGNLAYWVPVGGNYSMLETERIDGERPHIIATVSINGMKLRAMLDTGAGTSFVSLRAAARIGLKPGGAGVRPAGVTHGVGRVPVTTWIGPVASIKIGDEEIRNTRLRFGGDWDETDMLLGADFFLSHHVYWSNRLHKVFFTYNGGAVFDLRYLDDEEQDIEPDKRPAAAPLKTVADELQPEDAASFARRGNARASRGDLAGGLADLDRAVAIAPEDADLLWQRASLHQRMRQSSLALADADHVLKLRPDDVDALLMRAQLRRAADEEADIRADVDAASAAAPASSDRRLSIAHFYEDLGEYDRAGTEFGRWIAAHPTDVRKADALNGRCWVRALAGTELDRALKDCNAALALRPHQAGFLDSRGLLHLRMKDYPKAIADYDEALKGAPDLAWSHYGRGIARLHLGQKEAGEEDLATAHKLDPKLRAFAAKLAIMP
ncbi:retroviral-like aspartic protease family protein [Sphingomonas sp.]|uniref:retroviral-like aspartic protease family protein n=1 Tax=Sphingomonas sp. TaxID=28214 RepID=UPI003B3A4885